MKSVIRVGTRKSLLALAQTDIVKNKIEQAFPGVTVEIVKIDTKGDQILDRSLTSFGGKGVFTAELEAELLSGAIDIAVHSAKDMPMEFPDGLTIGAVLDRADERDTFVTTTGKKLAQMEAGSIIGTSSLRRELLIKEINPDVQTRLLRGNVQTRLRKLREGQYDGIILAAAGIERLDLDKEEGIFFEYLDPDTFLPAAGQGILAVESRTGDAEMAEILSAIHKPAAERLLMAERAYLITIGGSCNAPAAAHCREEDGVLTMRAMYVKDGIHARKTLQSLPLDADNPLETARTLGVKAAREVNKGIVYLVGAGPGDEDLITRKALDRIRKADVVVYDNLASSSLLNEVRDDAELIYAGKRSSHHHLKQYETNQLLVDLALEGKDVVRLKGGDPYIFGRGGEEGQELRAAGVDFEVIPGISSSYSVPAYCGIPVTHRDYASSFHVITGHEGNHKNGETVLDYATLAKEEGTLVFLMGLKNLPNIVSALIAHGKDPDTPVGVLQEGTTARQKTALGTLSNILEVVEREGIQTPAITVVGDVVGLSETLNWYGKKPLSGTSVLVTGSASMVGRLSPILKEEGAEAISFSLIRTENMHNPALREALAGIGKLSGKLTTIDGNDSNDKVGSDYRDSLNEKVSLADQDSSNDKDSSIIKENATVCDGCAEIENRDRITEGSSGYSWIVFTSANGVNCFFDELRSMKKDVRDFYHIHFAVIGDGTRKALEDHGFYSDLVPTAYSSEDMAEAILPHLTKDDRVLLLRAEEASPVLPAALDEAGIAYSNIALYHTVQDLRKADELNRLIQMVDYITFASSSAVKAFVAMVDDLTQVKGKYISIGPVTTRTAERLGLPIARTADVYTAEGILEAICKDVKQVE